MTRLPALLLSVAALAACGPADPLAGDAGTGSDAGFVVETFGRVGAITVASASLTPLERAMAADIERAITAATVAVPATDGGGRLRFTVGGCSFETDRVRATPAARSVRGAIYQTGQCVLPAPREGIASLAVIGSHIISRYGDDGSVSYTASLSLRYTLDGELRAFGVDVAMAR